MTSPLLVGVLLVVVVLFFIVRSCGSSGQPAEVGYEAPTPAAVGNLTYLQDLDKALGQIRAQTGLDKFELIGLDACLMSHIEVYNVLAAHARYAVASQETDRRCVG
jgi:hypothetical protein